MAIMSDEEAKAARALAPLGQVIVTEASNLARYVGRVLGTVPEDAVGLVIGDPLGFVRTAIAGQYDVWLDRLQTRRNVTITQPVSPSVAIPLIRAAYDESRPELQELWAGLIAAAMDPARSGRVRLSFIETLKQFDPLDALVLRARHTPQATPAIGPFADVLASTLGATRDEVLLSVDNLISLRCIERDGGNGLHVSRYGRALLAACSD